MSEHEVKVVQVGRGSLFFYPPTQATESWWIDADRITFTQRAMQEVPRMRANKESLWVNNFSSDRIAPPMPGKAARQLLIERGL